MRLVTVFVYIFFSFQAFAINEADFEHLYNQEVSPYYNHLPLRFHFYHDDSSKKFPYKFLKKGSKNLFVILPGKGEPLERYAETIYDLKNVDWDILLVQFRGQGFSSRSLRNPEKTYIRNYNYVIEDLHQLFEYLNIRNDYQEIVLLGHSMGAHHGVRYELKYPIFNHLILNSPMIGILDQKNTQKNYILAKLMISVGLSRSYTPGKGGWRDWTFEQNDVTQSMARYQNFRRISIENPTTRLGSVTVRWAYEAMKSEKSIFKQAPKLMAPVTIFQAGKEVVVSNEKQNLFCESVANCTLIRVENSMHNFLQEKDIYRNQFLEQLMRMLN